MTLSRFGLSFVTGPLLLYSALFPCAASAQQPITAQPMIPFGDGEASVLTTDLRYRVLDTNYVIPVPKGFVTDLASTPRAVWTVMPPFGVYQFAAIVHDFLYWDQKCTREEADKIFRLAMAEHKVPPFQRDIMHRALRVFGQTAWDNNAAQKAVGKPRIIPDQYLQIPPLVTWPEYQEELYKKGVRAQVTPVTRPDYCKAAELPLQ